MLYVTRALIRKLPGVVIRAVPLPEPKTVSGYGVRDGVGKICAELRYRKVLLVTDRTIFSLGYHEKITSSLAEQGIACTVFSDISTEPNIPIIEAGRGMLIDSGAEAVIALGGGAVMDSCKMIAAGGRLRKRKSASLIKKFLFVKGKTIPIIAVPTTAGTGAEITVGAVVTNAKGHKCSSVIVGLDVAGVFLDSELTLHAPRGITVSCGIDALSHGLEGVVASVRVSEEDMEKSMECVKLVLENLPVLLDEPDNIAARGNLCLAAHYGGNAINKQLAGYVHAFAHSIGAKYHIPHGGAIALSLLPVMNAQKEKCLASLAVLSRYCGIAGEGEGDAEAADRFLDALRALIGRCGLPQKGAFIPREDYRAIARAVAWDSINYSAPVVWGNKQIFQILDEINME